jgi:hypothetical protein
LLYIKKIQYLSKTANTVYLFFGKYVLEALKLELGDRSLIMGGGLWVRKRGRLELLLPELGAASN